MRNELIVAAFAALFGFMLGFIPDWIRARKAKKNREFIVKNTVEFCGDEIREFLKDLTEKGVHAIATLNKGEIADLSLLEANGIIICGTPHLIGSGDFVSYSINVAFLAECKEFIKIYGDNKNPA